MKDRVTPAIVRVFIGLGILFIISAVLLLIFSNEVVTPSFYLVIFGTAILNFIIAIYLNRKNKKNN